MQYYGHNNIIRKSTIAFMNLFNKIYIEKYRSDGNSRLFKVPIQFANREKWLQQMEDRINLAGNTDGFLNKSRFEIDMIFPRISTNIMALNYDTTRKIGKMQRLVSCEPCSLNELNQQFQYAPAPWDIEFELAIISKNMDDGLQILEQIIPFFQPSLSLDIKYIDGYKADSVSIILDSVVPTHDEELGHESSREFVWILSFRMKVNFHHPKKLRGRIQDVIMNVHPNGPNSEVDELTQYQLNATKLENMSNMSNTFILLFERDAIEIRKVNWDDYKTESSTVEFRDETYQITLIKSEGTFEYPEQTEDELYMTDMAGTTTYSVDINYNIISIKTTTAGAAVGAPQLITFLEKTTNKEFMLAISDNGDIEVA